MFCGLMYVSHDFRRTAVRAAAALRRPPVTSNRLQTPACHPTDPLVIVTRAARPLLSHSHHALSLVVHGKTVSDGGLWCGLVARVCPVARLDDRARR